VTKIEDYDRGQPGEVFFYAHASESMRTYLGLSKLHARSDCPALVRRGGTVVRDRMSEVSASMRCRVCHPELANRRQALPAIPW